MKVTIVGGGGVVGSSAAYRIAQQGIASEICLVDLTQNVAEAHALDIEQAVSHRTATRLRAGKASECGGADVIVMTAGVPHRFSAASRSEFLKENLPLVMELAESLAAASPEAVWIMATVPVDPLLYLIHERLSLPRHKMLGLNRNDSCRFRWAIAKVLGIPAQEVNAHVIGEHGESQVPLFSAIRVRGVKTSLTESQSTQVRETIAGFFARWSRLNPGRTAGWTSAESIGEILSQMATGQGAPICCSTPLAGEYGLEEVSLGVPVQLNSEGVATIVELDLAPDEKAAFSASATVVQGQIVEGRNILNKR